MKGFNLIPNLKVQLLEMFLIIAVMLSVASCAQSDGQQSSRRQRIAQQQEVSLGEYKGTIESNRIYSWTTSNGHVCWMVANRRDYETSLSCY